MGRECRRQRPEHFSIGRWAPDVEPTYSEDHRMGVVGAGWADAGVN